VLNKRQISGGGAYLDCYPKEALRYTRYYTNVATCKLRAYNLWVILFKLLDNTVETVSLMVSGWDLSNRRRWLMTPVAGTMLNLWII